MPTILGCRLLGREMSVDDYRRLALSLPEVAESLHQNHPDFRVRGKIFATLWPERGYGVVMLTREEQDVLVGAEPAVFAPVAGGVAAEGAEGVGVDVMLAAVTRGIMVGCEQPTLL